MIQIKLNQMTKVVAGQRLFTTTTLDATTGDIVGVVGNNGAGKSTLLKIIAGLDRNVEGQRMVSASAELVPQVSPLKDRSGGQETLYRLRTAFNDRPPILLLDEPTANLDENHQKWLIDQVRRYVGLIVVISHDQHFLRKTATKIWTVENQQFTQFDGNYDAFVGYHDQRVEAQQQAYERQHREARELRQAVVKRHQKAQRIRRGSQHMGRIERGNTKSIREQNAGKMERGAKALLRRAQRQSTVDKPFQAAAIKLVQADFPVFEGKTVMRTQNLTLKRHDRVLLKHVTMTIKPGERVALKGPNGAGKSSLIDHILQHGEDTLVSSHAQIGYFKQDITQLDGTKTVWQTLLQASFLDQDRTRQIAGAFGLDAHFYDRRVSALSGGERVKLQVLSIITSASNVLVLDEPTNFLDGGALSALARYLRQYPGTVLFVSHDVDFTRQVATRILEIRRQQLVDPRKTVLQAQKPSQLPLLQLRYDRLMVDPQASSDELRQLKQMIDELKSKN